MKESDLKAASTLAKRLGVKMVAYGPPGAGKTPIFNTAPNPVLCATEPGLLSMRNSNVPTWEAHTPERIEEFMNWLFGSAEAKKFDTVGFDSVSQLAEIILVQELGRHKDGRKAYGEMARRVMSMLNALYFMPQKHMYLIAKMATEEVGTMKIRRPYFPGQDLNVKVPHMFDQICYVAKATVPGVMGDVTAFRTQGTIDIMARDRSGQLAELESPNLAAIFAKCMQ